MILKKDQYIIFERVETGITERVLRLFQAKEDIQVSAGDYDSVETVVELYKKKGSLQELDYDLLLRTT